VPDRSVTLGVDIGSSATKAVLVEPEVGVIASASRSTALSSPRPGWAEADPCDWRDNLAALVAELLESSGLSSADVAAVGCAGMVPAVLCLDADGRALAPAILQNDGRATVEIAELTMELASVDLLRRTGSALSQQSVAPTIRWLQRHDHDLWAETTLVVGSYDWMAIALGARPHVEQNWGLESGLFDFGGTPVSEVWDAVGLKGNQVPELAQPSAIVGEVSTEAAGHTGLRAGTPIAVGGADHVLSAYGAGLAEQGDWLIKLGGAGDVLAVSEEPVVDPRLYLDAHPLSGLWLPNGCMATSGSLLRWLQAILGGPSLLTLDDEARQEDPAALVCLPYFLGEKSPHHDPDLRGAFIGLHLGTSRGALYRSALEAIAYGFRQHEAILREMNLRLGRPRVTNGGSKSTVWKQILADVLQQPLTPVVDHPGASLGAAMAAAVGIGAVKSWDAIGELVHTGRVIEPRPETANVYEEGYALYAMLDAAIRPLSHALARRGRS
jgi:xylulokinase